MLIRRHGPAVSTPIGMFMAALLAAGFAQVTSGARPAAAATGSPAFTSVPRLVAAGGTFRAVARAPKGSVCQLQVLRGPRLVGFSGPAVRVLHGSFTTVFPVGSRPLAGRWTASLRCAATRAALLNGRGTTVRRAFRVRALPGGQGLLKRSMAPRGVAPSPDGLGSAPANSRFGGLALAAADWAGGVDIFYNNVAKGAGCPNANRIHETSTDYWYCNLSSTTRFGGTGPPRNTGLRYQCVELINRMLVARGWAEPIPGNAYQVFGNAPEASFEKHLTGDGYTPRAGDIAVFNTSYFGGYGHVAIVDRIDGTTVHLRQQNTVSTSAELHMLGSGYRETYVTGILHARKNQVETIVQWDGDPKPQKTAWLVGADGYRRWIPDIATFDCLKTKGVQGPTALPAVELDRYRDLRDHWVSCSLQGGIGLGSGPLPGEGGDATPPSTPQGLAVSAVTTSSFHLSWAASSDNVGVAGYSLYRNGVWSGSGPALGKDFGGLPCGTTSTLGVEAFDGAGNVSGRASVLATTSPCPVAAPATYSETSGGAANTWTNYTNAGGIQGPTIPGFTTVQIACKIAGFRVADGNTWWYRIASSPWNGQFYVSADAFYNNGATSGSLVGTPFVDPNVPTC